MKKNTSMEEVRKFFKDKPDLLKEFLSLESGRIAEILYDNPKMAAKITHTLGKHVINKVFVDNPEIAVEVAVSEGAVIANALISAFPREIAIEDSMVTQKLRPYLRKFFL